MFLNDIFSVFDGSLAVFYRLFFGSFYTFRTDFMSGLGFFFKTLMAGFDILFLFLFLFCVGFIARLLIFFEFFSGLFLDAVFTIFRLFLTLLTIDITLLLSIQFFLSFLLLGLSSFARTSSSTFFGILLCSFILFYILRTINFGIIILFCCDIIISTVRRDNDSAFICFFC